jgi:hypothetical protein
MATRMEALPTLREIDDEIIQNIEVFKEKLGIECMLVPSTSLVVILM